MISIVPLHLKMLPLQQCYWPTYLLFRKTGKMLHGNAKLGVDISVGVFFKVELEENETKQDNTKL